MSAPHPAPRETWGFERAHIGRRVLVYDEVDSTNTLGAQFAQSDPTADGLVLIADHQRAGRGQYGRAWVSRPGDSLLLSVVLRPPPELRRPVVLTAWAAVAVADTVFELSGARPQLKWPNDLLVNGKKACGILIELRTAGPEVAAIAGIGLNLNQSYEEFARAGLPGATSLSVASGAAVDPRSAAATLIHHLDRVYTRLLTGVQTSLESEWKGLIGLTGESVTVEHVGGTFSVGRVRDVSFNGVVIEDASSRMRAIPPEQVAHLRPD